MRNSSSHRNTSNLQDDFAHVSYGGQQTSAGHFSLTGTDIEVKDINVSYMGSACDDRKVPKEVFANNHKESAIMVNVQDLSSQKEEPPFDRDNALMKIDELVHEI